MLDGFGAAIAVVIREMGHPQHPVLRLGTSKDPCRSSDQIHLLQIDIVIARRDSLMENLVAYVS